MSAVYDLLTERILSRVSRFADGSPERNEGGSNVEDREELHDDSFVERLSSRRRRGQRGDLQDGGQAALPEGIQNCWRKLFKLVTLITFM